MSTAEFSATANAVRATAKPTNLIGPGNTASALVVTDLTAAFTAADLFGANVIATTGDTYSNTTHKFTLGGATGLTHAQWATAAALYNTAIGDFVTAQTDAVAAAAAITAITADVLVYIGSLTNVPSMDILVNCLRRIEGQAQVILAAGSGNPRNP